MFTQLKTCIEFCQVTQNTKLFNKSNKDQFSLKLGKTSSRKTKVEIMSVVNKTLSQLTALAWL